MSNNADEERKKRFAELRRKAAEAGVFGAPAKTASKADERGPVKPVQALGSDKFKAASSALAGVFGASAKTAPKADERGPVKPGQAKGVSSAMRQLQAALENAKKVDEENARKQAGSTPASATPEAQPSESVAPAAPEAPMGVPDAPAAPEAPSAPEAPPAPTAPDMGELNKARQSSRTPNTVENNKVENKAAKDKLAGTAISLDALNKVQLRKTTEGTKPVATPAGGLNIALEAAKRRVEMQKRKAEGAGSFTPRTPTASAAPMLSEAQIKAQERAARAANPNLTKTGSKPPITPQADKKKETAKKDDPVPKKPDAPNTGLRR